MDVNRLSDLRAALARARRMPEADVLAALRADADRAAKASAEAVPQASDLVRRMRDDARPGLMEVFMAEYGLSTEEGVALMCLAEALLRVPDASTVDALIEDKIAPSAWEHHLGRSSSSLVNASTWGLLLTGRVLREETDPGLAATLHGMVKRLSEPVIRVAVGRAIRELGQQFVLGRTIDEAVRRGKPAAARGYTFSYDMLGEAAMTAADADTFHASYDGAIAALAPACTHAAVRDNPGISVKLSALHPRYEERQRDRMMAELVPRVLALARAAKAAGMGFNIDAEEADRLDLSLDVIEAVLRDPSLAGWDGFGIVVQGYGTRVGPLLDWLYAMAETLDRRIMVRLVKGAYWDTEIKHAQVEGLARFPVFTTKAATDVAYLCAAERLLRMTDRVYPQFATHNAHTMAAILKMGADRTAFEFQRLQGMGESLHDLVMDDAGTRCRIYAPVGAHRDLLAYLVRRLLENGANSSFVNQVMDRDTPVEEIAADPFAQPQAGRSNAAVVVPPPELFAPRRNSRGWNLDDPETLATLLRDRAPHLSTRWEAGPILAGAPTEENSHEIRNPARPDEVVGTVRDAGPADIDAALDAARVWTAPVAERAEILRRASDLYEAHTAEIFALVAREAGKSLPDAVAELREAVDFLRYYADEAEAAGEAEPRGTFACISPWNFPLAIFTGQIAAALAAGNAVIAKPAETTTLTAAVATRLLHEAGVPRDALQLLPGAGRTIGAALAGDPRVAGICFTGSLPTAQAINRAMAETGTADGVLIAETGGVNAMIVDSTALPEQAIRDVLISGFQSAGQRCSALRVLYLQDDIAEEFEEMLAGAMDCLRLGDPLDPATDIGPVIDAAAKDRIDTHLRRAREDGRVLHELVPPRSGHFVGPAAIRVAGIEEVTEEVFGPVVHVARFGADDLDDVVAAINASGYGLTCGIHSRINERVARLSEGLRVGNTYVNRNQIGAIVGSQPFGGEGLSGTGPKAGGPAYLPRFRRAPATRIDPETGPRVDAGAVQAAIDARPRPRTGPTATMSMPGPTGESNRLAHHPRGLALCLGPTLNGARSQAAQAAAEGCATLIVAPGATAEDGVDGVLDPAALATLNGIDLVIWQTGDEAAIRAARQALAARDGPIVPLVTTDDIAAWCRVERHLCIDTTASGGNVSLLAAAS